VSKIQNVFNKGPAYVGYLTVGDGGLEQSFEYAMALIEGGVNILEMGVPFSDPIGDGPTIQAAAARALTLGVTIFDVLNVVKKIKEKSDTPIILFSYYNPVFIAGRNEDFFVQAKAAGVDGILIVDLPIEEASDYLTNCRNVDIDPILLISPSTPSERIQEINRLGKGMLYYICRSGTTGVKNNLPDDFVEKMQQIRSATTLPVVVGFGVSNREMAASILKHAKGFVVGSFFVDAIAKGMSPTNLKKLVASIDPRGAL
jgi:tryptophan synthase alpha chain